MDPSGGLDNVRERGRETERIEVTEKERKSKRMAANTNKTVCPTQVSNKPFFFPLSLIQPACLSFFYYSTFELHTDIFILTGIQMESEHMLRESRERKRR